MLPFIPEVLTFTFSLYSGSYFSSDVVLPNLEEKIILNFLFLRLLNLIEMILLLLIYFYLNLKIFEIPTAPENPSVYPDSVVLYVYNFILMRLYLKFDDKLHFQNLFYRRCID